VGTARRVLRDVLAAWGLPGDALDDAVLVTSELVTNALVHAAGERIVCRLRDAGDRVRVEVEDQNRGQARPVPRRPGPGDQNGRGLFLVDVLSVDWGVTVVPGRTARVVWAELAATGARPGAAGPAPAAPHRRTVPHSSEGPSAHDPHDVHDPAGAQDARDRHEPHTRGPRAPREPHEPAGSGA
jgi:anti-sigma regulatory factor (Ser/Thr protein kinase)